MSSNEQFSDKVFLVTGASSGIGETLVIMLASNGASVTLCGQNEERLESVRHRCVTESGGHVERFTVAKGDLRDAEVRKMCVQATIATFGKLDVLVPNAGLNEKDCGILTATEEAYNKVMDINVKAVFFLIQEAVPYLKKSKGCIVSVSSISSFIGSSPNIIYPMSKAAIDHMTRCLALDLAPSGVRVNAVNPSFTPTRISRYVGDDKANDEVCNSIAAAESMSRQILGQRCLTTTELANAIIFLASKDASFITGQCLAVDDALMEVLNTPSYGGVKYAISKQYPDICSVL